MILAIDPVIAVESVISHWTIVLLAIGILWVGLRELSPVRRVEQWLE